jgi:hypothetical protein
VSRSARASTIDRRPAYATPAHFSPLTGIEFISSPCGGLRLWLVGGGHSSEHGAGPSWSRLSHRKNRSFRPTG